MGEIIDIEDTYRGYEDELFDDIEIMDENRVFGLDPGYMSLEEYLKEKAE